jgi:hypothetical protein
MAVAGQSTRHQQPVDALLEGAQQMENLDPAGARNLDHLHRRWILKAQAAG